jgi:hypothetical protein
MHTSQKHSCQSQVASFNKTQQLRVLQHLLNSLTFTACTPFRTDGTRVQVERMRPLQSGGRRPLSTLAAQIVSGNVGDAKKPGEGWLKRRELRLQQPAIHAGTWSTS